MKKLVLAALLVSAMTAAAQKEPVTTGAPLSKDPSSVATAPELKKQAAELLAQAAKSDSGSVTVTLEKFPTHFMMINARVKSGGGEIHEHYNDMFVVLEGEATLVTGGRLVDETKKPDGEHRGTRVEGGTEVMVHKGDIVHVSAGTPHQTMVSPGKSVVYYVIKIQQ